MLYSKPIVSMQGNYSHHQSSTNKIYNDKMSCRCTCRLATRISSHIIIIITLVPPNLGRNLFKPLGGAKLVFVQPAIPYSRQYKRPLNYLEYKNDSDQNVHV